MVAKEGEFLAKKVVKVLFVAGIDGDESLALLLVELLFLEHADFVFGCMIFGEDHFNYLYWLAYAAF